MADSVITVPTGAFSSKANIFITKVAGPGEEYARYKSYPVICQQCCVRLPKCWNLNLKLISGIIMLFVNITIFHIKTGN